MFLAAKRDVCLHRGTEGVDVTVRVLEGEHVVAFRERIEVGVVFKILFCHIAIERFAAALIGEKKIFRQSVRLIPCVRGVLVWPRALFCTRQCLLGQVGDHGTSELFVDVHCYRIVRIFVSVYKATRKLVVCVCGKPVVDEEFGFRVERFSVSLHQAIDLGARRL